MTAVVLISRDARPATSAQYRSWFWSTALLLTFALTGTGVAQPMLPEETLDQWIFGSGNDARTGRQTLEHKLTAQVAEVQQLCSLSEEQTAKLQLAGMGDIKHFFNRADKIKRRLAKITDENAVGMAFQEIQPLQQELARGIFRETSLFDKVLRRLLDREQAIKYRQFQYQALQARYRSRLTFVLLKLEDTLPMLHEQRQQLLQLALDETAPPTQFGPHDSTYVLWQLSKLPEDNLRPIFDDRQWQVFRQSLQQASQFEQFLRGNGIVPYSVAGDAPALDPAAVPLLPPQPQP